MQFLFRHSLVEDYPFYQVCFDCEVYYSYLHGEQRIRDFKLYLERGGVESFKFVFFRNTDLGIIPLGFCHFYPSDTEKEYEIGGGITPSLFNAGYGVYSYAQILAYIFTCRSDIRFRVGVLKTNQRSLKIHFAFGFQLIGEFDRRLQLTLTRAAFDNEFVRCLLLRSSLEYRYPLQSLTIN